MKKHHGGAIENSMRMLMELKGILETARESGIDFKSASRKIIKQYKDQGRKLPGFGHRIHNNDPRTAKLFSYAEECELDEGWVRLLKGFKSEVNEFLGRELPVNVDGTIAALLLELDIAPELANSFFIMARVPGLVAHIHEEKTLQKPMRRIDPVNHVYTGISERDIK